MIVEPSSSYEELPSPVKPVLVERVDEMMNVAAKNTATAPISPDLGGRFAAASDGGSGVGFFELDEELDGLGDHEFDYHEVSTSIKEEKPVMLMKLQNPDEGYKKDLGEDDAEEEPISGSFHAGSLPINIVRPGSFK